MRRENRYNGRAVKPTEKVNFIFFFRFQFCISLLKLPPFRYSRMIQTINEWVMQTNSDKRLCGLSGVLFLPIDHRNRRNQNRCDCDEGRSAGVGCSRQRIIRRAITTTRACALAGGRIPVSRTRTPTRVRTGTLNARRACNWNQSHKWILADARHGIGWVSDVLIPEAHGLEAQVFDAVQTRVLFEPVAMKLCEQTQALFGPQT